MSQSSQRPRALTCPASEDISARKANPLLMIQHKLAELNKDTQRATATFAALVLNKLNFARLFCERERFKGQFLKTLSPTDVQVRSLDETCCICMEDYDNIDHNPVEVVGIQEGVGHVFGGPCLSRLIEGNELGRCPLCRTMWYVNDMHEDLRGAWTARLVEVERKIKDFAETMVGIEKAQAMAEKMLGPLLLRKVRDQYGFMLENKDKVNLAQALRGHGGGGLKARLARSRQAIILTMSGSFVV